MRLGLSQKDLILLKIFIWMGYAFFFLVAFTSIENHTILYGIGLSGILIQLTVIPFLNRWCNMGSPRLLDWFRLTTFVVIVLNFIAYSFSLDRSNIILVNSVAFVQSEYSFTVLLVTLVGLLGIKLGEFISKKRNKELIRKESSYILKNRYILKVLILFTTGIQVFLIMKGYIGYASVQNFHYSNLSFLFQIIQIVSPFLLVFLSTIVFKLGGTQYNFRKILWAFFALQIFYGALTGMKENILAPIVLFGIPYLWSGRTIPKWGIISGVVFVLLIYPLNNTYRAILNSSQVSKTEALETAVGNSLDSSSQESLITLGVESYLDRLSLFPYAMYAVQEEVNWKEYKNLDRYLLLPLAWIVPRFILPEKPASDTGAKLYKMLTGNSFNSVTPSTYGWAYLEGGLPQVFASFVLFGLVIGFLQIYLETEHTLKFILFPLILLKILKAEADIYFMLTGIFQTLLISFLLLKFFTTKQRSNS